MNNTILNIKKVSLIFFIITGILHLSSSMLIANNQFLKQALIINKSIDIPFVLTGLLYGLSSIRLAFTDTEKDHKILDIILAIIIVVILATLIIINLVLPDLFL